MVDLTLRVLYKPGQDLQALYRTLGQNYAQRLLPSVGNEVMKAVLAQYNVSELLTRRSDVCFTLQLLCFPLLSTQRGNFFLFLCFGLLNHLLAGFVSGQRGN